MPSLGSLSAESSSEKELKSRLGMARTAGNIAPRWIKDPTAAHGCSARVGSAQGSTSPRPGGERSRAGLCLGHSPSQSSLCCRSRSALRARPRSRQGPAPVRAPLYLGSPGSVQGQLPERPPWGCRQEELKESRFLRSCRPRSCAVNEFVTDMAQYNLWKHPHRWSSRCLQKST